MKRKDLVSALLSANPPPAPSSDANEKPARVAAGSVRAMGLELHRLNEEADQAQHLRQQLEVALITPDRTTALRCHQRSR